MIWYNGPKKGAVSIIWIFPKAIDGVSQNQKAEIRYPESLTTETLGTQTSKLGISLKESFKNRNFRVCIKICGK